MAEYIEREAVMLQINIADFVRDDNYEAGATLLFQDDVVDRISSIPAADVRPVVTCADCKHWDIDYVPNYSKENKHFCPMVALTTQADWFCADGERREES